MLLQRNTSFLPLAHHPWYHVSDIEQDLSGIQDEQGTWIISPRYKVLIQTTQLDSFAVEVNEKWGVISTQEEWLVSPVLSSLPFYISPAPKDCIESQWLIHESVEGQYGFQNEQGAWVIAPRFAYLNPFGFDDHSMCAAATETGFGFIDSQGNWVIEPRFDIQFLEQSKFENIGFDHLGNCMVQENGLWGYIDRSGAWVMAPIWEFASSFDEFNLAVVSLQEKFGLINPQGTWVVENAFTALWPVSSVGYIAQTQEGKDGLLGADGQWILSPVYDSLHFWEGPAIWFAEVDGLFGFINLQGEWLVSPILEKIVNTPSYVKPNGGLYIVHHQGNYVLIDLAGKIHFQAASGEGIEYLGNAYFKVYNDKLETVKYLNYLGQEVEVK